MVCKQITVTDTPASINVTSFGFARDRQAPIPNEYINSDCKIPYSDVDNFNEAVIIDFTFSNRFFLGKVVNFTATFTRPDGTIATLTGQESFVWSDIIAGERVMITNTTKYVVGTYSNLQVTAVEV